jgi:repressor LexA
MAKEKLSERQRAIVAFIERFTRERGYPPTIREIGEAASISSTSVVNYNLNRLIDGGHIVRDKKVSRGVRLADTGNPRGLVTIPLAGYIFASAPVLVDDAIQTAPDEVIELTHDLVEDASDLFALRVKGDSMIDAMVGDGDVVVMRKADRARNGEMVAIWLRDRNETTLKHFYLEGGHVRLQPANPTMQPIIIDDPSTVEIQGKVVLVVRKVKSN